MVYETKKKNQTDNDFWSNSYYKIIICYYKLIMCNNKLIICNNKLIIFTCMALIGLRIYATFYLSKNVQNAILVLGCKIRSQKFIFTSAAH